jgi:phage recombination protein Bet
VLHDQEVREMSEQTQEMVRRSFDPSAPAYKDYDEGLISLIKNSVMPREATNADTYFLLELSSRYGLDPFAREIWAAKMKGKTGEAGGVTIMVGRDGLLSIAERHKSYAGFRNHPVYENDSFAYDSEPRKMPDGTYSHVKHSFDVTKDRGKLLGAWAEVYRKGRPPTFFYAPLEDYLPKSEAKLQYSPWSSQINVMIAKCALATALRLAFRISGLYIEEEMTQALSMPESQEYVTTVWPEDEELASYLQALFAAAEDAKPGSWLPGKVTATMEETEDYEQLAEQLAEEILSAGGTVPERGAIEGDVIMEFERAPVTEEEVAEAEFEAVEEVEFPTI